jgi:hypothetical protein
VYPRASPGGGAVKPSRLISPRLLLTRSLLSPPPPPNPAAQVLCLLPERPRADDEAPTRAFTFLLAMQNASQHTQPEISVDESQARVLRLPAGSVHAQVRTQGTRPPLSLLW